MNNSYSSTRLTTFGRCKKLYKDKYIDYIKSKQTYSSPSNSRIIGNTLHKAMENIDDKQTYMLYYLDQFIFKTQENYTELLKIQKMRDQMVLFLKDNIAGEYKTEYVVKASFYGDILEGQIDLIEFIDPTTVNIFDFKFSGSIAAVDPFQLNFYKFILELNGLKVNKMKYITLPQSKIKLKEKNGEDIKDYIKRINSLRFVPNCIEVDIIENMERVVLNKITEIERERDYDFKETDNCKTCINKQCQHSMYGTQEESLLMKQEQAKNEMYLTEKLSHEELIFDIINQEKNNIWLVGNYTNLLQLNKLSKLENANIIITDLCDLNKRYGDQKEYLLSMISLLQSKNKISAIVPTKEESFFYNGKIVRGSCPLNFSRNQMRYFLPYLI